MTYSTTVLLEALMWNFPAYRHVRWYLPPHVLTPTVILAGLPVRQDDIEWGHVYPLHLPENTH